MPKNINNVSLLVGSEEYSILSNKQNRTVSRIDRHFWPHQFYSVPDTITLEIFLRLSCVLWWVFIFEIGPKLWTGWVNIKEILTLGMCMRDCIYWEPVVEPIRYNQFWLAVGSYALVMQPLFSWPKQPSQSARSQKQSS